MQIGSALGIAVIGVIFFALLTNHAPFAVADVTPEIRTGLQAAGVPEPVREQMVAGFSTCFTDRMAQKDPFVLPPSCIEAERQAASAQLPAAATAQIEQVMSGAADRAVRSDFGNAMQRSVWFQAGLFLATFVLVFLLPRKLPHHEEEYESEPVPAGVERVADY
jgi:preprotein translocase subunit SecG